MECIIIGETSLVPVGMHAQVPLHHAIMIVAHVNYSLLALIYASTLCAFTYLELLQSSSWLVEHQREPLAPQQDL